MAELEEHAIFSRRIHAGDQIVKVSHQTQHARHADACCSQEGLTGRFVIHHADVLRVLHPAHVLEMLLHLRQCLAETLMVLVRGDDAARIVRQIFRVRFEPVLPRKRCTAC